MHIIVVGAGVIGSCTAYFLSQRENVRVTIIEKTEVACGASGKAGGFLWSEGSGELSKVSYRLHEMLARQFDGKNRYGYRAVTTYSISMQEEPKKARPTNDTVPAWLHQDDVLYCDELGSTKETAQVHPRFFTRTILEQAQNTGRVQLVLGKGVTELLYADQDATMVTGVALDDGTTLEADRVVLCIGPWATRFEFSNKALGTLPIIATRAHSIVMPVDEKKIGAHALFTEIKDTQGNTWSPEVYPRPDATVYMCGEQDAEEPLPATADQVKVDAEAIATLQAVASKVSPHLNASSDNLIAQQACYLPHTRDHAPLIGKHPAYKQLFVSCGHSVWGILLSPISGLIMTELILDDVVKCVS
ncbi:FAD dependent oxidoreductase, partial [Gongronella butleri]